MKRMLGGFEALLMFAVLDGGKDAHSVTIRRLIEDRADRVVSPGAIHTGLDRLQKRGLVTSSTGETTPGRGGRPRRYYALTRDGAVALRRSHDAVLKMATGLDAKLAELAAGADGTP